MVSFKNNKATRLFVNLLKQGTSPKKLALCVALGFTIGLFPVFGTTTPICIIAAFLFRLNQAAIQVVNYAVFPLWFITVVPFFKIGETIFNASPIPFTHPKEIAAMFKSDGFGFLQWGASVFHAIVAWLLISPLIVAIIYFSILPLFKKQLDTHR